MSIEWAIVLGLLWMAFEVGQLKVKYAWMKDQMGRFSAHLTSEQETASRRNKGFAEELAGLRDRTHKLETK